MYKLTSHITIGTSPKSLVFDYVNNVQTTESADTLTNNCTIILPRNLKLKDKNIRDMITQGAPVAVEMGYNGQNECVFNGWVKRVIPGVPVSVECEDDMYLLKKITIKNEVIRDFKLREFLKRYLPKGFGTPNIADLSLGEIRIAKEPTLAKMLSELSEKYPIRFFFRSGILYGALPSAMALISGISTHKLKFNYNILSSSLIYTLPEDFKLIVKAKAILKNNHLLEVQEPKELKDGNIATYFSDTAKTEAELRLFAKEKLKNYKPEGLSGDITIFGLPYVQVADHVLLLDDLNQERNNKKYMVSSVTRTFNTQGYRQKIKLGTLISDGN